MVKIAFFLWMMTVHVILCAFSYYTSHSPPVCLLTYWRTPQVSSSRAAEYEWLRRLRIRCRRMAFGEGKMKHQRVESGAGVLEESIEGCER